METNNWKCNSCTLINPIHNSACTACGNRKSDMDFALKLQQQLNELDKPNTENKPYPKMTIDTPPMTCRTRSHINKPNTNLMFPPIVSNTTTKPIEPKSKPKKHQMVFQDLLNITPNSKPNTKHVIKIPPLPRSDSSSNNSNTNILIPRRKKKHKIKKNNQNKNTKKKRIKQEIDININEFIVAKSPKQRHTKKSKNTIKIKYKNKSKNKTNILYDSDSSCSTSDNEELKYNRRKNRKNNKPIVIEQLSLNSNNNILNGKNNKKHLKKKPKNNKIKGEDSNTKDAKKLRDLHKIKNVETELFGIFERNEFMKHYHNKNFGEFWSCVRNVFCEYKELESSLITVGVKSKYTLTEELILLERFMDTGMDEIAPRGQRTKVGREVQLQMMATNPAHGMIHSVGGIIEKYGRYVVGYKKEKQEQLDREDLLNEKLTDAIGNYGIQHILFDMTDEAPEIDGLSEVKPKGDGFKNMREEAKNRKILKDNEQGEDLNGNGNENDSESENDSGNNDDDGDWII